ncbi:MAG: hypothetical protein O3B41_08425 [Bacteroidetes bacterium]|nr:hypothetical protein [Bacteroidota bacterium]
MNKFCPSLIAVLLFAALLSGCSPRLSPLYRDFEVKPQAGVSDDDVFERIDRGLLAAGWSPIDGPTENVLATEPRQFRQWGVYGIEVDLELAPVGGEYVRMLIHPYRVYFTGKRSKIPYLRGSLARSILGEIQKTFEAEGLTFIGTAESRNKAAAKEH